MKKDIHPQYTKDAKVTCSCGNTFTTGSTQKEIKVELCSACHPFYTGEQKLVDSQGQISKFSKKFKNYKKSTSKNENSNEKKSFSNNKENKSKDPK